MERLNDIENQFKKPLTTGEKALTSPQVDKLLLCITDLQDLMMIKIAISTGIRRGDIVTIKCADINVQESTITFYEQKKRANHTVPLSKGVMTGIEMLMKTNKSKWLFPAKGDRDHISSKTTYNRLNYYLIKCGIGRKPFHALRGTCAKMCQTKGWPVERTAKLLNDTIKTVQGHYTTPSLEEMKETAQEKAIL